jgi:hypothetical protein
MLFPASPVLRTHIIPMFVALSALHAHPSGVAVLCAHTSIASVLCAYSSQVPVHRAHTGTLCSERTLPCIDFPLQILRGPYRYFVLPFMFTALIYTYTPFSPQRCARTLSTLCSPWRYCSPLHELRAYPTKSSLHFMIAMTCNPCLSQFFFFFPIVSTSSVGPRAAAQWLVTAAVLPLKFFKWLLRPFRLSRRNTVDRRVLVTASSISAVCKTSVLLGCSTAARSVRDEIGCALAQALSPARSFRTRGLGIFSVGCYFFWAYRTLYQVPGPCNLSTEAWERPEALYWWYTVTNILS